MRKLLRGIVMLALFGCVLAPNVAHADRIINYYGENPDPGDQNQKDRFMRDSFGTFAMQLLGLTSSGSGAYAGLTVYPQTSLNVEVDVQAGAQGMLIQVGPSDTPIPAGVSPQLAADSLLVGIPYFQQSNSGGIAVPAPTTSGQSVYYLIEAQGSTVDTDPISRLFDDQSGNRYYQTVNTVRADQIVYRAKAGTPGVSPTVPTVDAGYVALAKVLVPYGATNCSTSCTVTMLPGSALASQLALTCASCVTGQGGSGGALTAVAPLSVSATTFSCASCVTGQGGSGGALTAAAPLSVAGTTVSCATCVTSVSASGNLSSTGGTTPAIALTSTPTFASITNSNLAGSGTQVVCTGTSGVALPCIVGGTSHFPDHGVAVLINASDGCGSYSPCATSNSTCPTGSDCGSVQFSTTDGFCSTGFLANYQVAGTGNSGADTTPGSVGWLTGFSNSPQTSVSQRVHFFNLTGSALDFSSGSAHAMLAGAYTCLY